MSVLNVPNDVLRRLGESDGEALLEIACRLYETKLLKFDEAARLAGVELEPLAAACASRRIPVYWVESKDVDADLAALKKMNL